MRWLIFILCVTCVGAISYALYAPASSDVAATLPSAPLGEPESPLLRELDANTAFARTRQIYERIAALPAGELPSVADALASALPSAARDATLSALLQRWVDEDQAQAASFFRSRLTNDAAFERLLAAWFGAWLQRDAVAALRFARALQSAAERDAYLRVAIAQWGPHDARAQRLLDELSESARADWESERLQRLPAREALERALAQTNGDRRMELAQPALARFMLEDFAGAWQMAQRLPTEERETVLASALAQLAERNPDAALQFLQRADASPRQRAIVLEAVAVVDASQAFQWLEQGGESRAEFFGVALPSLLEADVERAARAVAQLGARASIELIQETAAQLAREHPHTAYAWALGVDRASARERNATLQAVSASVVAVNASAAQAYFEQSADLDIKRALMQELARAKAQDSVLDAWRWLANYRSDPAYRDTARGMLSQWAYAKPAEVAEVVRGIEDFEFQRAAAEQLASVWREKDPAAFLRWARSLPNERLREVLLAAS